MSQPQQAPQQRKRLRLGEFLLSQEVVTQIQLEDALADQRKSGASLGQILVERGILQERQLLELLARLHDIPYVDLVHYPINPEVVRRLSEIQARRFRTILLQEQPEGYLVGMADPANLIAYDELSNLLKRPILGAVVREADLLNILDRVYRKTAEITGIATQISRDLASVATIDFDTGADLSDAPVAKLLQNLFEDAVQIGASDIHIEPDETVLRIRQRIDGVLQEHVLKEKRVATALLVRLKIMAGLDISEKRLPQDGRFSIRARDRLIDVRLSTLPVQSGEAAVMRLLDKSQGAMDLEELGMPEDVRHRFERLIGLPHGVILVTGPTGSGKTTTLYAALSRRNDPETKIVTVEDPVEYKLPRVSQVQVNTEIGLTFARVLRATLRQDPDVILVGEIRDEETMDIALRAAMTGHLVLSTLHTNDAISTIHRLADMGAKGYLIAAAIQVILAQRLVRRICSVCKAPATLSAQDKALLAGHYGQRAEGEVFYRGGGCQQCSYTGYRGRSGIYQLLEMDDNMSSALVGEDFLAFKQAALQAAHYQSLERSALDLARKGITSLEEAAKVSSDIGALILKEQLPAQDV